MDRRDGAPSLNIGYITRRLDPLADFRPLPHGALRIAATVVALAALVVPPHAATHEMIAGVAIAVVGGILVVRAPTLAALITVSVVGALLGAFVARSAPPFTKLLAVRAPLVLLLRWPLFEASRARDLSADDSASADLVGRAAVVAAIGSGAYSLDSTALDLALLGGCGVAAAVLLGVALMLRRRARRRVTFLLEVAGTPGRYSLDEAKEAPEGVPVLGTGPSILVLHENGEGYRDRADRRPIAVVRS